MKRTIRSNVFETNSSSCHSVTVQGKSSINTEYIIDGEISIYCEEYGWDGDPCDDFYTKLEYAMSMVLYTEYPEFSDWDDKFDVDQDVLETLPGYQTLLAAIQEHGYCPRIIIEKRDSEYHPYGYIDHQSREGYNSLQDFLDDWDIDAERFLFDDNIFVLIDNDNH